MRWNDAVTCIPHLYRLFCASVMLRDSRVAGKHIAHNYPKMILANILILEHWRVSGYVGRKVMNNNMHMFNEELGEISFSVLSRCVLGDNNKSDFGHMQKMYKLLPVYRELRDDMLRDTTSSESINSRHYIKEDDANVRVATLFFQRTIRQIVNGEYRSYNGSVESYKSSAMASQCYSVTYQPLVYKSNISSNVLAYLDQIKTSVTTHFLYNDRDIWPEADMPDDNSSEQESSEADEQQQSDNPIDGQEDFDELQWGADARMCIVGNFALCRAIWNDGRGVKIVKIKAINVPRIFPGSDEIWPNFTGKVRICTVVQTTPQCLAGTWNHHPQLSIDNTVASYEVIVYFSHLHPQNKLPPDVVSAVRAHAERERIFEQPGDYGQ